MSLLSPCSVGFGPFFMPETFCRRPRDASEIVYSPSRGEPSEPIYSATSTELFASARAAKSETLLDTPAFRWNLSLFRQAHFSSEAFWIPADISRCNCSAASISAGCRTG